MECLSSACPFHHCISLYLSFFKKTHVFIYTLVVKRKLYLPLKESLKYKTILYIYKTIFLHLIKLNLLFLKELAWV
jgi:hypothetical protein